MTKVTRAHVQAARTLKHLRMSRGKPVDEKTMKLAALDPNRLVKTPGLSKSTLREDLLALADSPDLTMMPGNRQEIFTYVETYRIREILANHPEVR